MVSISKGDQASDIDVPLPDGSSPDLYPEFRKWSKRRWAWEFLRRNEIFQKKCRLVETNALEPKLVAEEFQLREFAHFRSDYAPKPKKSWFKQSSLKVWPRCSDPLPISLRDGEILISFKVPARSAATSSSDETLSHKESSWVKKQIRRVRRELNAEIKGGNAESASDYSGFAPIAERAKRGRSSGPSVLIKELRFLDLWRTKSLSECAEILRLIKIKKLPNGRRDAADVRRADKRAGRLRDSAVSRSLDGYQALAFDK